MIISLIELQRLCAEIPDAPAVVRSLLDKAGIEVHSIQPDAADYLIDVELLANRGDHRGLWGVATEVAAHLGVATQFPSTNNVVFEAPKTRSVFESTHDFATVVGTGGGLAFVALANDVSHELGQPLHVYDRDKLNGSLRVRHSEQGERVHLSGYSDPVILPAGVLVVADETKIVAIAGTLGCVDSSPDQTTTNVLVESACYDPREVRKSASALRISTTASQRCERGGDRGMVYPALQRLAYLVEFKGVGAIEGPGLAHVAAPDFRHCIAASRIGAERVLGLDISQTEWSRVLGRLGFVEVETDRWLPPHARVWDVVEAVDIYEEYARLVGFDNILERVPSAGRGVAETPSQVGRRAVSALLNAHGFFEVITSGTYGEKSFAAVRQRLADTSPLLNHVHTAHAQASEDALLRNNIFVNIRSAIDENHRNYEPNFRLYEYATVFMPSDSNALGVDEQGVLWGLAAGDSLIRGWQKSSEKFGPHHMVGILEQIALALRQNWRVEPMERDHLYADLLHPFQRGIVVNAGTRRRIGVVGSIHPGLQTNSDLGGNYPVMFQVDSGALLPEPHQSREVSGFAPVVRMLDFVLHSIPADAVRRYIKSVGPEWLREVYIDDVYQIPGTGYDSLSVTFGLSFEPDAARAAAEINAALEIARSSTVKFFGSDNVTVRGA